MRILVTGAYGLIGSACLARLHRDGHDLRAGGRSIGEARLRAPYAHWVELDFDRLTLVEDWLPLLRGIDAVVNCVGVLQDSPRDDLRRTQVVATTAMFAACEQSGVRLVHVSVIGAEASAPTEFARSRAEAERDLANRNFGWIVLRPGLVVAPAAYGGTAMLRGLAGFFGVIPMIAADADIQVIGIDDLTETVSRAVDPGGASCATWDVVHPQRLALRDVVLALRRWLGFRMARIVTVPHAVAAIVSRAADVIAFLGWRSPARTTAMRQLSAGVVGDPQAWLAATGIAPKSLAEILAAMPPNVQERWFARLYLLKPVALIALAGFWIYTGVIALTAGRVPAEIQLAASGFWPSLVAPTVFWGAIFDIVMGAALLVRPWTRHVLSLMLIATVFYIGIGTALAPRLWLDPLGPLIKIVPMLVASALTLAIVDER